jgi:hypothetical protein
VNVAKTIVGSGEDLKNMKRYGRTQEELYDAKESYDTLLAKVDKLSVPKKAPARKVADKQSNKEPDSEMMII